MTVNQNQFQQSEQKGRLDLKYNPSVISCAVKSDESAPLVPGQAVTMADTSTGVPEVSAVADDADDIFGFVAYNQKSSSYDAGDEVEIAFFRGSVMYMEASAAIARRAEIAVVVTGSKIKTAVSTDRIVGRAIDKAAADGDLIRVVIDLPGAVKS